MMLRSVIFLVLVKVFFVKCECNTYLDCLESFFDNLFNGDININTTKARDIVVPGFDNVGVETEIDEILTGVSDFIREELDGVRFGPINVRNVGDNTAIYVKTITIHDGFGSLDNDDIDYENITEINLNTTNFVSENSMQSFNTTEMVPINDNVNKTRHDGIRKKVHENEIPDTDFGMYYDGDDNSTDYLIIDYIDLYKDTTNEYIEVKPTETGKNFNEPNYDNVTEFTMFEVSTINYEKNENNGPVYINEESTGNISDVVFPWVAAIFIKNDTSGQFDYYCDGALLSNTTVVTAARCTQYYGKWAKSENIIVLLGKISLNSMSENEKVFKVKDVLKHENFTTFENDIAVIILEEAAVFNDRIQPACLGSEEFEESMTTGWAVPGDLTLIKLDTERSEECGRGNNTFCAVYGNDVTVCPSYGGIHVTGHTDWCLRGIRTSDPSDRGLCFDRKIIFTDLSYYVDWLKQYIE